MRVWTWIIVMGLALPVGGTAAAVDVNRVPSEMPHIEVLAVSAYGVLYKTDTDVVAEPVTWAKPTGRPAYRVDEPFGHLAGDKIYSREDLLPPGAAVRYQVIGSPVTRTCAGIPHPAGAFTHFGWISADGHRVEAGATGCRVTAKYPALGGKVGVADTLGYVVVVTIGPDGEQQLRYHSYADPTHPRVIDDGGHNRWVHGMALSGSAVTWAQFHHDEAGRRTSHVVRSSTDGSKPHVVRTLDTSVWHTAIAGEATGWAGCGQAYPLGHCTGGTFLADGTRIDRPGTASVVGDGSRFVFDTYGASPGIDAAALVGPGVPLTRLVTVGLLPPTSYAVSIGAGGIAYVDSQGPTTSVSRRVGQPLGPQVRLTDPTPERMVARDGRRTAYVDAGHDLWLVTDDGARNRVFDSVDKVAQVSPDGGLSLSGTRLLWTRGKYTGIVCEPLPNCYPTYYDRKYMLYDLRTGKSTELPYRVDHREVVHLWGSYLAYAGARNTIWRRDLSSGRILQVKAAGSAPLQSVAVHGDYVGWATCVSYGGYDCGAATVGYRNMATRTAAVVLRGFSTTNRVRLSGGHLAYDVYGADPGTYRTGTLRVLRLGTRVTGTIATTARARPFDIHDQTLAWIGPDDVVHTRLNSPFVAPPRYLGNALGSPILRPGGLWTPEFSISKALPVCGVTIRRGTTIVRSLGCATGVGSARVFWNGRDSAGRLLPKGSYTWTLGGRDADGWLRWWNGSTAPIRGTVTIA